MQEVPLPGKNPVAQPVQCRMLYQTAKERHPAQYWQGVLDKTCAAVLWVLGLCICFTASIVIRTLKNYLFYLTAQSIYKSPKTKIVMDMLCGFNSPDRKSRLSIVCLIQIKPLYLQGGLDDIHQQRTPSNELGVIPLARQVFYFHFMVIGISSYSSFI